MTIDGKTAQCVNTPDLEEAEELLEDRGQVILSGPPGCGKTTLALALLRKCREQGFTPHIISKLEKLDSTDIKTSVASGLTAFLLDGTLGRVRMDRQQHELWAEKRPGLMELVDQGRCRLIITLYPHVLRELRELESGIHSPLPDRSLVVQVGSTLDVDLKEKMLDFHLKKLQLGDDEYEQVVQTVLQTDSSGRGFPWCCQQLVKHWSTSKDTAIFSAPEETHALLFKEMVIHPTHSRLFAGVLALMMRGFHNFLHASRYTVSLGLLAWLTDTLDYLQARSRSVTWLAEMLSLQDLPRHVQPELARLGFDAFSDDQLAEYADVLRGSILTEDGQDFASRVLYNAAALALGRSFRLPTMLRACDAKFLVERVRTRPVTTWLHDGRDSKLCITVGLPVCSSASRPVLTTPEDLQSLLQKVVDEIMSGHLPEICQHPSLQCPEFLLALEQYCQIHNESVEELVSVVDPVHGLPLVYWSAFCRSHTLTQWCLTQMTQTKSDLRQLPPPILLACALFDRLVGDSCCRMQSFVQDFLTENHFIHDTDVIELPLLRREQCLLPETLQSLELITAPESDKRKFHCLSDPSYPVPDDMLEIEVTDGRMEVKVRDRQQWYLALRLLTDREVDGKDQEEKTLLHLAINSGDIDVIQLAVNSRSSLLKKTSQGETAYQVAETRRGQHKQEGDSSIDEYFSAIRDGDMVKVKTLLCYAVSVEDKDCDGNTGLHVACKEGQKDIADLLIRLYDNVSWNPLLLQGGTDVNTQSLSGKTALHSACQCKRQTTSVDISCLLLVFEADVNVKDENGHTPLHDAIAEGHTDTADLLLHQGADINVQDKYGNTPLHDAIRKGYKDTADLLIRGGANINVKNTDGHTPVYYAYSSKNPSTISLLIQGGAEVARVHQTAARGDVDAMRTLIRQGADVNQHDPSMECSPLHVACTMGHSDLVTCLLQYGAHVGAVDGGSCTPLHQACRHGHAQIALSLITQDADVNAEDGDKSTPLHKACEEGHHQTALCLLEHGANVNAEDWIQSTPLHEACEKGHYQTALCLVQHGARVSTMSWVWDTPFDVAVSHHHNDVIQLLTQHGATSQ